jgi:hypothetical protein
MQLKASAEVVMLLKSFSVVARRQFSAILSGAWKPIIRLLQENSDSPSPPLNPTQ